MVQPTATWELEKHPNELNTQQSETQRGEASPLRLPSASVFSKGFLLGGGLSLFLLTQTATAGVDVFLLPFALAVLVLGGGLALLAAWLLPTRLSPPAVRLVARLSLPLAILLAVLGVLPSLLGVDLPFLPWIALGLAACMVALAGILEDLSGTESPSDLPWLFSGLAFGSACWGTGLAAMFSQYGLWAGLIVLAVAHGVWLAPHALRVAQDEASGVAGAEHRRFFLLPSLGAFLGLLALVSWTLSLEVPLEGPVLVWFATLAFVGAWALSWLVNGAKNGTDAHGLLGGLGVLALAFGLLLGDILPYLGLVSRQALDAAALLPLVVSAFTAGFGGAAFVLSDATWYEQRRRELPLGPRTRNLFLFLFPVACAAFAGLAHAGYASAALWLWLSLWLIWQTWIAWRGQKRPWVKAPWAGAWLLLLLPIVWSASNDATEPSTETWSAKHGELRILEEDGVWSLAMSRVERYDFEAESEQDSRLAWGDVLARWTGGKPRRAVFLGLLEGRMVDGFYRAMGERSDLPIEINPLPVPRRSVDEAALAKALRLPDERPSWTLHWGQGLSRLSDGRKADVIVQDAFDPAVREHPSFSTEQWYRRVRSRLSKHGLFVQLIPLAKMDRESLKRIVRGFAGVFPAGEGRLVPQVGPEMILALCSRAVNRSEKQAPSGETVTIQEVEAVAALGALGELKNLVLWETLLPGLTISDPLTLADNPLGFRLGAARKSLRRFEGDTALLDDITVLARKQDTTQWERAYGHLVSAWEAVRHGMPHRMMVSQAQALRLAPGWTALRQRMEQWVRDRERPGDYPAVLVGLRALRDADPTHPDYALWLANIHFKMGAFQEAMSEAKAALDLNSDAYEAFVLQSAIHLREKRFDLAVETMMEAYARKPEAVQRHVQGLERALEREHRQTEVEALRMQRTYLDRVFYGNSDQLNVEP